MREKRRDRRLRQKRGRKSRKIGSKVFLTGKDGTGQGTGVPTQRIRYNDIFPISAKNHGTTLSNKHVPRAYFLADVRVHGPPIT